MDESDWPVIDSIDMDTEEGINLFNKLIIEYPHSEWSVEVKQVVVLYGQTLKR